MKNGKDGLEEVLKASIEAEEALMRTYLISAERVKDDDELKEHLENFAQENAKRTKQLIDELQEIKEESSYMEQEAYCRLFDSKPLVPYLRRFRVDSLNSNFCTNLQNELNLLLLL